MTYFELRLKKNYYTHITIIENCNSFKEELFLHQHKFRVLVTKQKIVLIDLFRNDFSIPQTPRGPLSLLFYSFTENTVLYLKKQVSHFGTNKLYSIEPNLWLLLNWVGFLITILVIQIKTFFHLCYAFLSSSLFCAFLWRFCSFAKNIHRLWKLLQSMTITIRSR